MNVNMLYVIVTIVALIICFTLAYFGISGGMSDDKFIGLLALVTCLSLFIVGLEFLLKT